jgi:hypothetical protein
LHSVALQRPETLVGQDRAGYRLPFQLIQSNATAMCRAIGSSAGLQAFAEQTQLLLLCFGRNMLGKEGMQDFLLLIKLSPQLPIEVKGSRRIHLLRGAL